MLVKLRLSRVRRTRKHDSPANFIIKYEKIYSGEHILTRRHQALLSVFRGRLLDKRDGDTAVERCEVYVQDHSEKGDCRLVVKMVCRHGMRGPLSAARMLLI